MTDPAGASAARGLSPARDAAMQRLARQARLDPDLDLSPMPETGLDARDAALAHAIVDEAVRRWRTIEFRVQRGLTRPFAELQPELRAALLAGGAQILFFDHVPVHAAIDETVEWAKQRVRPGAAGLVNAALRRLAEQVGERSLRAAWGAGRDEVPLGTGGALALRGDALPEPLDERLAVATGLPTTLVRAWERALSRAEAARLAVQTIARAPTILNVEHATGPLPEDVLAAHDERTHRVFTGARERLVALLRERPDLWAQDSASAAVVREAAHAAPGASLILDVCAGRGTKTRQLAAMFPGASIVATDVDDRRRATLASLFHGHSRVRVVEPRGLAEWFGRADLTLIDSPCSNTGVLARRVEARRRATDATIEALAGVQRQIIADSVRLPGRRGRIVYATCSLDERENRSQTLWALKWHSLRVEAERTFLPAGGPGEPAARWRDGSYVAVLATG